MNNIARIKSQFTCFIIDVCPEYHIIPVKKTLKINLKQLDFFKALICTSYKNTRSIIMKVLKVSSIVVLILLIAFVIRLFLLGKDSQKMTPNGGLLNDQLKVCGEKPNCVSSYSKDKVHTIKPFALKGDKKESMESLAKTIKSMKGAKITTQSDTYIKAEFTSGLMGFVDDVEFHLKDGAIQVRSESRVGYSDMGANRKRIEAIRMKL